MSNELAAQRTGLKEGILKRKVAFVTGAGRGIRKEISARVSFEDSLSSNVFRAPSKRN